MRLQLIKIFGLSFFTILIMISSQVHAEYRVYEYLIYPLELATKTTKLEPKIEISSLPLNTYANFKNIGIEQVFLKRTWTCGGHTGHHRAYCQSPYLTVTASNSEVKSK